MALGIETLALWEQAIEKQSYRDPLAKRRKEALALLKEMGLPTLKTHQFKSVTLSKLYRPVENSEIPPLDNKDEYDLVISDDQVFICNTELPVDLIDLREALMTFASFLDQRFARVLSTSKNPFTLLNFSEEVRGALIMIPKNTTLSRPLRIAMMGRGDGVSRTKLLFAADSNAQADVVISYLNGSAGYDNDHFDWTLAAGSRVRAVIEGVSAPKRVTHLGVTVQQKRDSNFSMTALEWERDLIRFAFDADLEQEGAHCEVKGLAVTSEKHEVHNAVLINHRAPKTTSNQCFKHLLEDGSKTSFCGKIYIEKEAQETNAYQLNRNLLLSRDARAFTQPGLEIFADDVKASHGATIAHLDEELGFYLQSRGISQEATRQFLVRAFVREILDSLPCEKVRSKCPALIKN